MNLILSNAGLIDESSYSGISFHSDQSVYEVIRVIDGIPLFLEDHFDRLLRSMQIQGLTFQMAFPDFKQNIAELVRLNQKMAGNIKFVYSVVEGNIHWAFSFIPHSYPTSDDYQVGVETGLLFAERKNPNAKVIQTGIRDEANQMISDRKLYEVLLVDSDGLITEGSRSNVFFVKNDIFYTAPASMILEGITWKKVLVCLNELGFSIAEEAVHVNEISQFDAAFMTGTSPKILPIRLIGSQVFDVRNDAVVKLVERYNRMIQDYIRNETNRLKDS
jgi:branched-chain amino acid aminotransferase